MGSSVRRFHLKALTPVMCFLQQDCTTETSLNSATNWEPCMQIAEPMGDISHSSHLSVPSESYKVKGRGFPSPLCFLLYVNANSSVF